MQEIVAEVVQIKKEKLDEALKRQAEDEKAIRSKAAEVSGLPPAPTFLMHALVFWHASVFPSRLLTRRTPLAGEGAPRKASGIQRAPHPALSGGRMPNLHGERRRFCARMRALLLLRRNVRLRAHGGMPVLRWTYQQQDEALWRGELAGELGNDALRRGCGRRA